MKKFLIISASLLALALIATIAVFWYVSTQLKSSSPAPAESTAETSMTIATSAAATPAQKVPLNESQREVLETVGVDPDTFVITPAMQACAAEKLSADRVAEIAAGAAPTALETMKLLPCLGAE